MYAALVRNKDYYNLVFKSGKYNSATHSFHTQQIKEIRPASQLQVAVFNSIANKLDGSEIPSSIGL